MKKKTRGAKKQKREASPSRLIDARVKKLGDWRGETLARIRTLIRQADPDVVEEVKWRKPSNAMLGGTRRNHLHRRDIQGCREDDFCQGRFVG